MVVDMDEIYRKMPLESIPWNSETPPGPLVRLVETGQVTPCRAIDLGCGAGNYVIWLASRGFDATGVDLAPTAIAIARANAVKKGVRCQFIVADLTGDLRDVEGTFDFAFDWEVLHHIFPQDREKYVENVHRLLNPGGKYLSVCFSEEDREFPGRGKFRTTGLGTELYLSSVDELKALFGSRFRIIQIMTIKISNKFGEHIAICAFMEK